MFLNSGCSLKSIYCCLHHYKWCLWRSQATTGHMFETPAV